ncbi:MAG: DNA-directed RNA polymerase subunit delta [Bacillota bacterium]|nr:DNA-directed RNA polymerase subunit delta [Bacillota bacterium]MDI7250666.1 DNA-directed RNA polymerase subunit delta [Bacillota bacterium]
MVTEMAAGEGIRRAPPSTVDIACQVLREMGRPMHFRELCDEIMRRRQEAGSDNLHLARIYTDLNLDHRLTYLGEGNWGLREWQRQRISRSLATQLVRPVRKEPPWREEIEQAEEPEGEGPGEEEEEQEDEEESDASWDAQEEEEGA